MASEVSVHLLPPDLSSLPEELLASIALRLPLIADYVRFGAVCTSWNSVAAKHRHRLPGHLPWLLLPPPTTSTSNNTRRVCGSGDGGWLITVDDDDDEVSLFNPFTGLEIPLPPFSTEDPATPPGSCSTIRKAVLSSPPASASDSGYVVLVLYGDDDGQKRTRLASLFRPAGNNNDAWVTDHDLEYYYTEDHDDVDDGIFIADVISYKGRLYAVDGVGRVLEYCCLVPGRVREATEFGPAPELKDYHSKNKRYLVESVHGDLLQAVGCISTNTNNNYYATRRGRGRPSSSIEIVGMEVFKLHQVEGEKKRWGVMCTSDEEEEQILVLGRHASFALSASRHFADSPAACRGTWIYDGGFCYSINGGNSFTYTMISRKMAFLSFFKKNVAPRVEFLLKSQAHTGYCCSHPWLDQQLQQACTSRSTTTNHPVACSFVARVVS